MQNRYAGDVGDFGKLGLLRRVERSGLRIGINWYLVPDESHNNDGKHVKYLTDSAYDRCDDELRAKLATVVHGSRSVESIEKLGLLKNATYYRAVLDPPTAKSKLLREEWNQRALAALSSCDIVFLDPDNGLLPKSVSPHCSRARKHVTEAELAQYYHSGQSIVFYNHRSRQQVDAYLERFRRLRDGGAFEGAQWIGLNYAGGSRRDFFFILQPRHAQVVRSSVDDLLQSGWSRRFSRLAI